MGKFIYGSGATSVDVDDRALAHIRLALTTKLRRGESCMFDLELGAGLGRKTFWVHPGVPLQFHFFGSRIPRINRAWVEELIVAASSPGGLWLVPEPKEPSGEATLEAEA